MDERDYEELAARFELAVRTSKRATQLALLCVAVAFIVMVIDNGIKKHVVAKANEARQILDEFERRAADVRAQAAGEAGVSASSGIGAGDDVVHDAAAGAAVGPAKGGKPRAARPAPARVAGGTGGDGGGAGGS